MITLLGNWQVANDEFGTYWTTPEGCLGAIDLASAAQIEASDPTQPRGLGLFLVDSVPAGWDGATLSSDHPLDAKVDGALLDAWQALTGYRPSGDTVADILYDHMTFGADPAGLDRCLPLLPGLDMQIPLWLGGQMLKSMPFSYGNCDYSAVVKAVLVNQLAATLNPSGTLNKTTSVGMSVSDVASAPMDDTLALQAADFLCEKYASGSPLTKEQIFDDVKVDAGFTADAELVPHETSLSESFNQADSTTLGPDQAWTEVLGNLQTASNIVQIVSTSGDICMARCNTALSGVDQYAQIDQNLSTEATTTRFWGPACRYSASANTAYVARQFGGSSNVGIFRLAKLIAGTYTNLGTGTSGRPINSTAKIQASGTTITIYVNGSLIETITDSAIDGSTVGGKNAGFVMQGRQASFSCDNWAAADLAAATVNWGYVSEGNTPKKSRPLQIGEFSQGVLPTNAYTANSPWGFAAVEDRSTSRNRNTLPILRHDRADPLAPLPFSGFGFLADQGSFFQKKKPSSHREHVSPFGPISVFVPGGPTPSQLAFVSEGDDRSKKPFNRRFGHLWGLHGMMPIVVSTERWNNVYSSYDVYHDLRNKNTYTIADRG